MNVIDKLYGLYYEKKSDSLDHVSSYWRNYLEFQHVNKGVNNSYEFSGYGFIDYKRDTFLNTVKNIPSHIYAVVALLKCDNTIVTKTKFLCKLTKRTFGMQMARMALTVELLTTYIGNLENKHIVIIGDGFGALGSLIKLLYPKTTITYINLGKVLIFDAYYSNMAHPSVGHYLKSSVMENNQNFNYIEAENIKDIKVCADIFINMASFQEMNLKTIHLYFSIIRDQPQSTYLYSCNRLSKTLPDGMKICFEDYGWQNDDIVFLNELCPWHQKYPLNRPPFVRKYDGQHWHKLIKIEPKLNG